jgi:CubicO group peptidase (beta-lactamase class C family)
MTDLMTMDRRGLIASLAALTLPGAAVARQAGASQFSNVQQFIDSYVQTKKLPGMVWGFRRQGAQPVYISAGTLDYDTPIKCAPNSIFRIYSMTKPIIGVAIMRLIEDGKLTLDTPIGTIVPEFRDMKVFVDPTKAGETRPAAGPILIRHLLTHTAGLSYSIGRGPLASLYIKEGITPAIRDRNKAPGADLAPVTKLDDFVQRLSKMPLNHDPGTVWEYAVGIDLLGYIIQVVTKQPLWDHLRTTIFNPLKMVDTDFVVAKDKINRFASVYALQNGQMVKTDDRLNSPFALDRDLPSGGGGLTSTAIDYLRFTTMLVNGGTLDGARIIKPESVRTMGSNLMPPGVTYRDKNGYGAAVEVALPGGELPQGVPVGTFWWTGIAGTQMWVDPVNKLSAVLMIQQFPTSYPVGNEVRVATYKDVATIKA